MQTWRHFKVICGYYVFIPLRVAGTSDEKMPLKQQLTRDLREKPH